MGECRLSGACAEEPRPKSLTTRSSPDQRRRPHPSTGCEFLVRKPHYVVEEIDRGDRLPLDLDNLPHGVWQYYAQFWNRWQNEHLEKWDTEHLQLMATLGALQEPAPLPLLCSVTGLVPDPSLGRLLEERWRPFLTV